MEFNPFIFSKFMVYYVVLLINFIVPARQIPSLNPGDIAPPFAIPTLDGRIFYKSQDANSSVPAHPVVFHAYSKYSAFLEAMWRDKHSLKSFIEHTPRNTHYVFLTFSGWAERDALWMRKQLHGAIDEYFAGQVKKSHLYCHQDTGSIYFRKPSHNSNAYDYNSDLSKRNDVQHHSFDRIRKKRMLGLFEVLDKSLSKKEKTKSKKDIKEKEPFYFLSRKANSHHYEGSCPKTQAENLKRQLHFVNFPIHELGNWIPYILGHWTCFGVSCALSQVAFKTRSGEIIVVARRLDARYDWLPSPFQLTHMHTSLEVVDYGTACHIKHKLQVKKTRAGFEQWKRNKRKRKHGKVALVSSYGDCSLFEKIKNMAKTDVDTVLIYPKRNEKLKEPQCHKHHCFHPLAIAASMIPYNQGIYIHNMLSRGEKVYVQYQTTPQDNYFFAIDGQGKLAEVGMFLFPSLQFLAYEAKWFNYKTDLIHNVTGSAMVIPVFRHALMKGHKGVTSTIHLPPMKDLLLYRNVELDMALHCPGRSDYSCPHWDHVIHLTVCCKKENSLCGEELGRWISPYRRSVGRWLTNITPLLPMFTSRTCNLTMAHPFWEKPWKPSLSIRFSDHIKYSKHHYSGKQQDANVVPYKIIKLFQGGKFDKNYNKRYSPLHFSVPDWTKRAKLVATITGHGSDDHGCAEFCVTSHHFIFNGHANVRVFKNAATATGCAQRVAKGVEPNEHGTWLYGRDGWCPGQDVVPWVVDVTDQMTEGEKNRVNYFGLFRGKDPHPKRNPGEIIMNSYLVFYRSAKDIINDSLF